jgi:hypothetical protein
MNSSILYKLSIVVISAILYLILPTAGFSVEDKNKSLITSVDATGPLPGTNFYRGEFVTVTAHLRGDAVAKFGSLAVRFYLSSTRDGSDLLHEFDIFHDIPSKSESVSTVKHAPDGFHDVIQEKSGNLSITGRYIIPYSVTAGDSYWIVVEVTPEEKTFGSPGNKTKTTFGIVIPCDKLVENYNINHCGDHD